MDSYHRSFGLPVTVVRPFNTYGPHQSARAVVPTIISQALAGPTVRLGSLDPRRDLTFVADTCAGVIAAALAPAAVGRTVQLGTGHDVSVREIVDLVSDLLGKELSVERDTARIRPEKSEVGRPVCARRWLGSSWDGSPGSSCATAWGKRSNGSLTTRCATESTTTSYEGGDFGRWSGHASPAIHRNHPQAVSSSWGSPDSRAHLVRPEREWREACPRLPRTPWGVNPSLLRAGLQSA